MDKLKKINPTQNEFGFKIKAIWGKSTPPKIFILYYKFLFLISPDLESL